MKTREACAIVIGLAAGFASTGAHADWQQYKFADLGIYKDFPVAPKKTVETYKTPLAKTAPATVLTAVDGGIVYTLTVVDFAKRANEGFNLGLEAAERESGGVLGTYTLQDLPNWDHGANLVCGMELIIEKDGDHIVEDIVFNKGRLYLIKASVPEKSPARHSPSLSRFMDTSQFYLKGYGFNFATGRDYPVGDDDPLDRDARPAAPGYKPPPGAVSGPLHNGFPGQ